MRVSQPLRIFAVHLVFMLAIGALGLWMVNRAFDRYKTAWEQKLGTIPAERLFSPLATEVARSLLLKLEHGPSEPRDQLRATVADGLDKVLPALPGPAFVLAGIVVIAWIDDFTRIGFGTLGVVTVLTVLALGVDSVASLLGARRYGGRGPRVPA